MPKGMKKSGGSDKRRPGEPHCGCSGCDRKPERNSWYCWRHDGTDPDSTPALGMLTTMSPLMMAA